MIHATENLPFCRSVSARPGRRTRILALVIWALGFAVAARPAAATITYRIHLNNSERHLFHVEMMIPKPGPGTVVALPAWNALYQIKDFSYRVRQVRATANSPDNMPIDVRKLDKQSWQISCPPPTGQCGALGIVVDYSVEWNDPGPFTSQLNAHHAFINLAEILMYVPNRRSDDTEVQFVEVPNGWKVVAELPTTRALNTDFAFVAPNYDALVDAPVEAGEFEDFEFDEGGAHFRVVVDGKEWTRERLSDGLRRISRCELKLMGGAPFKEYTFLIHIGPYAEAGGGGMEHANSTAIAAGSEEGALAIAAHEFFHVWNVKRIRPRSLEPFDYRKEQYTRALWFAEGVTSTYASYTLERTGLWGKEQFYGDLAWQITALASRPSRKWQSVEESSLDAWFEKYDGYNAPDRSISYYNKGQILGVMLDLAIRDATDNRRSLDDVLRRMNDEYAKQRKFYNDSEGVRSAVEEIAGKSFEDFFHRYVSGTDEIPYDGFLNAAGLECKFQTVKSGDIGFDPGQPSANGVTITAVEPGSAAEAAGLLADDVVVRVNGRVVPERRGDWIPSVSPGDPVKLRVDRNGQEMDIVYRAGVQEEQSATIAEISHPSDRQRRILRGLLKGTTD
jgi:predicted metalloprotease with PDZ domain